MSVKKVDGSQSLTRGIHLIEFLSDYPNGCSLQEIAELTDLNKSTAHRLLSCLQSLGYVTPTHTPGSYRITSRLASVGNKAISSLNIIGVAASHLERLNLATGETVNFSIRESDHCVLIYKLEPTTGLLRTRSYVGQHQEMYCSGMGKQYLAFSPEGYLEQYWESNRERFVKFTSTTIVDINVMRHELARVREEKISYDREENELGVGCIAAPIFDLRGRVDHAVSVSIPTNRMNEERRLQLADMVKTTAREISRELGGADFIEPVAELKAQAQA